MNLIKRFWHRLFVNPTPAAWYCGTCYNREALPGTHLCPGPIKCGICNEEIIFIDPYGAFNKHPCFGEGEV